jgi:hypothetical protein
MMVDESSEEGGVQVGGFWQEKEVRRGGRGYYVENKLRSLKNPHIQPPDMMGSVRLSSNDPKSNTNTLSAHTQKESVEEGRGNGKTYPKPPQHPPQVPPRRPERLTRSTHPSSRPPIPSCAVPS